MLNKQIELLRHKKGWSQAELAQRLHISPSTVGMYEQGRREPSIDVLVSMSEEFGVTIDYLVTGKVCTLTDPRISKQTDHVLDSFSVLKGLSREDLMILVVTKLMNP
jgi:transcriptional regulator with XRE-family HTH domain